MKLVIFLALIAVLVGLFVFMAFLAKIVPYFLLFVAGAIVLFWLWEIASWFID